VLGLCCRALCVALSYDSLTTFTLGASNSNGYREVGADGQARLGLPLRPMEAGILRAGVPRAISSLDLRYPRANNSCCEPQPRSIVVAPSSARELADLYTPDEFAQLTARVEELLKKFQQPTCATGCCMLTGVCALCACLYMEQQKTNLADELEYLRRHENQRLAPLGLEWITPSRAQQPTFKYEVQVCWVLTWQARARPQFEDANPERRAVSRELPPERLADVSSLALLSVLPHPQQQHYQLAPPPYNPQYCAAVPAPQAQSMGVAVPSVAAAATDFALSPALQVIQPPSVPSGAHAASSGASDGRAEGEPLAHPHPPGGLAAVAAAGQEPECKAPSQCRPFCSRCGLGQGR